MPISYEIHVLFKGFDMYIWKPPMEGPKKPKIEK